MVLHWRSHFSNLEIEYYINFYDALQFTRPQLVCSDVSEQDVALPHWHLAQADMVFFYFGGNALNNKTCTPFTPGIKVQSISTHFILIWENAC